MKNTELKQIINQIKKYKLESAFKDEVQLKKWISNLNDLQISNFLSLNIDLEDVFDFKNLLVNCDLLNCEDYKKRVTAISNLKNGDGCFNLFDTLCKPNFLKSENFYKDLEMLSKADDARYGLWVLGEDDFINSPYHDEDLRLIVEARDTNKERKLDYVVANALADVAKDKDSINSPYHQEDMRLISIAGSNCLQPSHSYPEDSLNNLAVNPVSLSDKYHRENMKILATRPVSSKFLYKLMTNQEIVKSKYYRQEVEALLNAKSEVTARALYYYIINPEEKFQSDIDYYNDREYDRKDAYIPVRDCVAGICDPEYLNNLKKINKIDDKFVMHYVSLLMNRNFIKSKYKSYDLDLLETISDKEMFMDLYRVMTCQESLSNLHHITDVTIISEADSEKVCKQLIQKATDKTSLKSINHDFDMRFILNSNLWYDTEENLSMGIIPFNEQLSNEITYYLFSKEGMDDPKHKEKLEKLSQGIMVERDSRITDYLNMLQAKLDEDEDQSEVIESPQKQTTKSKSKILSFLIKVNKKKR